MKRRLAYLGVIALGCVFLQTDEASAQPGRQMPGSRITLPGSPVPQFPPTNSRVRPASQTGTQTADAYAKPGYPKFLGDGVEQGSGAGGGAGIAGGGGGGGIGGAAGGGIAGGGALGIAGGGGGGVGIAGFAFMGNRIGGGSAFTGGGFTGLSPKGFGFGGTPDFSGSSKGPLNGGLRR